MPQHEEFSLDREESLKKNIDATGKKWHIVPVRGLALYEIDPMDARVTVPKCLQGRWTKLAWVQAELDKFLVETWDKAATTIQHAERKEQAKKEAKKKS
jgi:hypothetical protein